MAPSQRVGKNHETALKKVEKDQNVLPDLPMVYEALDEFGVYSVYYRKEMRPQSSDHNKNTDLPQQPIAPPSQKQWPMKKRKARQSRTVGGSADFTIYQLLIVAIAVITLALLFLFK